ncbi:hypothetical protein LX32DRAFT_693618 [Colletotrichum zoysiae]|uniref:Uncharacterized protein n=1 Tax=Colletotrichum zoysiae TaxID=1216348 RepID=A0AAD9HJ45_9PEZI|nr:hypothetical protein LX32DRAFT_693618 [Colletotrichum zoysiae]
MTSNPLVTSLPTIPSTWTAPTSCFASTNYYRVFFSRGDNVFFYTDLYGVPMLSAPTGDCLPPSFTVDAPYITDGGCPAGFTSGCVRGVAPSTVTCCPSVTGDAFVFKAEQGSTENYIGFRPNNPSVGHQNDLNSSDNKCHQWLSDNSSSNNNNKTNTDNGSLLAHTNR